MKSLTSVQRILLGIFCVCHVFVPLFFTDLYPFTSMPMFSAAPQQFVRFVAFRPDGSVMDPMRLGIFRRDFANPSPRVGIDLPYSVFHDAAFPTDEAVTAQIKSVLAGDKSIPFVTVERTLFGAIDAQRVGAVETRSWRIEL